MNRKEYMEWVEYVNNNGIKPPKVIYENYDDWIKKLTLARFLSRKGYEQYVPALKLMKTILKDNLSEFNKNDDITYEAFIEDKIWTLMDIGELYWIIEEEAVKALDYLEQSLDLAESVDYELDFLVRGEIWNKKLRFLMKVKGEEVVLKDIQNKIQFYENNNTAKTNSYLFNGYYVLSNIEKEKGNQEAAINQLKKALEYFPLEDNDRIKLSEIWDKSGGDLVNKYEQMEELTFCTVAWNI